jgi:hypothetical protein
MTGDIKTSANFEVRSQKPLDSREKVNTLVERDSIPNISRFVGLKVFVNETQGLYILKNGILNSNWEILDGDKNYVHIQDTPSSSWNINHNLGKFPNIQVISSSNDIVEGDINHIDNNNATINFVGSFSGKAFLN